MHKNVIYKYLLQKEILFYHCHSTWPISPHKIPLNACWIISFLCANTASDINMVSMISKSRSSPTNANSLLSHEMEVQCLSFFRHSVSLPRLDWMGEWERCVIHCKPVSNSGAASQSCCCCFSFPTPGQFPISVLPSLCLERLLMWAPLHPSFRLGSPNARRLQECRAGKRAQAFLWSLLVWWSFSLFCSS